MESVFQKLKSKQQELAQHPFFRKLDNGPADGNELSFVPYLTFWVMSFQDVLRLNDAKVTDPFLKRLSKHHKSEDSGHDRWFLSDLKLIGTDGVPDTAELFGRSHQSTRDATYSLMSEVFLAQSDLERIVLLLALEHSGHIFFESTAAYIERAGVGHLLKYFSRYHIDIEKKHEMFEDQLLAQLRQLEVSSETLDRSLSLVDRCFQAFSSLFDGLV